MLNRNNENVFLEITKYAFDNTLAIVMICEDGQTFGNLTVNIQETLEDDCAFIDENNLGEDILSWVEENNVGKFTGRVGISGFCMYPEVKFNLKEIEKHAYK